MNQQSINSPNPMRFVFFTLLVFLGLAVIFSIFRGGIGSFNRKCLTMTGEIAIKDLANRGSKVDVAAFKGLKKGKKKKGKKKKKKKAAPKKLPDSTVFKYKDRKRPRQKGFFAKNSSIKDVDIAIPITSKQQVAKGLDKWSGPKDCSAHGFVRMGEKGITINVKVIDDVLAGASSQLYRNDSVEIYLDTRPAGKRGKGHYGKGVFQLMVAPYFIKDHAHTWWFNCRNPKSKVEGLKVKSSALPDGNGYQISMFLPYKGFEPNHFKPGDSFNFDIGINDDDGKGRETQMMWSGEDNNFGSALWFGELSAFGSE